MLGDFRTLLEGIAADPERRISGLQLLTEAERSAAAPARAKGWSVRLQKRLRRTARHARRAAGRFLRAGRASPLVGILFTRIEEVFGRLLPPTVTDPFRIPAVEQFGDVLRWGSGEASRASLVEIQRHGSRPPFFCAPGSGDDVLCFHALAQYLGLDQPFYAFQPRDQDGEQTVILKIEDIAANYVRELRELQPEGPYFLGGHSSGGLVAFEMARQLRSQGEDVALLALFDTGLRAKVPIPTRLHLHARRLRRQGLLRYVRGITESILRIIAYGMWLRFGYSLVPQFSSTVFANMLATRSYKAQPYSGRVTLFRATEPWKEDDCGTRLGWEGVAAGGMEVHEVPGDHFTLLEEPHVQILAAQLKACLDQTQANSS
jgi:thioesterase domain-containing protein